MREKLRLHGSQLTADCELSEGFRMNAGHACLALYLCNMLPSEDGATLLGGLVAPGRERGRCCCNGRLGVCSLHAGHICDDLICGWVVHLQAQVLSARGVEARRVI